MIKIYTGINYHIKDIEIKLKKYQIRDFNVD